MDGMKKSVAKGLALALVAAMVQATVADGFVRKREARNYMPTYGNYQHEGDVNETMREEVQRVQWWSSSGGAEVGNMV